MGFEKKLLRAHSFFTLKILEALNVSQAGDMGHKQYCVDPMKDPVSFLYGDTNKTSLIVSIHFNLSSSLLLQFCDRQQTWDSSEN